jgi:hypothetical protein
VTVWPAAQRSSGGHRRAAPGVVQLAPLDIDAVV